MKLLRLRRREAGLTVSGDGRSNVGGRNTANPVEGREVASSGRIPEGFTVNEVLGEGGTAVVWRAHSDRHGDVALKVWKAALNTPEDRDRFLRECRNHNMVSPDLAPHPNIVAWVASSPPYGAHPWIATRPGGISIARVLREPPSLPLRAALMLSLDLLDGLADLHARGLVHGDVTPGNVLYGGGRARLCDLGIAWHVTEPPPKRRVGTASFMAPEVLAGGPPSFRADVYSAAVTMSMILDKNPIPSEVDHLVHTVALSHRPEDRPLDGGDFARRLRDSAAEALHLEGIEATRHTRFRWSARISVSAAALGIVAAVGVPLMIWDGAPPWGAAPAQTAFTGSASASPGVLTMMSPTPGARVASPLVMRGTVMLREDQDLWILARPKARSKGYEVLMTQPVTVDSDGGWEANVNFGLGQCDLLKTFELVMVVAPRNGRIAQGVKRVYREGQERSRLSSIPSEVTARLSRDVVLIRYSGQELCDEPSGYPSSKHSTDRV